MFVFLLFRSCIYISLLFASATNDHVGKADTSRELLEIPKALDYYSNICQSNCEVFDENQESLGLNSCQKCTEKHSPCNFCCQESSSSLRLKWHGCMGNITLLDQEETHYCQLNKKITRNDHSARFLSCKCYESFIEKGYLDDGCVHSRHLIVSDDSSLCIVSVNENDSTIDLSRALPSHIVLRHSAIDNHDDMRPDWNTHLITAIDTSCGEDVPPIFPGFGKFANSCPLNGIIDLGISSTLPPSIDYHFGDPPKEMFWYEYVDGTSTGFWPSTGAQFMGIESLFFSPTFASCSCAECSSTQPSREPSLIPTVSPTMISTFVPTSQPSASPTSSFSSAVPSVLGTAENSREFVRGRCPASTYEECGAFAHSFCITNGKGNTPFGETCAYSPDSSDEFQRKLTGLEEIVDAVETGQSDRDAIIKLLSELYDKDNLSGDNMKEFLEKERLHHLKQYNMLGN